MQSTTSIISALKTNYPQFSFIQSTSFWWSPPDKTVHYNPKSKDLMAFIFHELSHAVLNHKDCKSDIKLVTMERQAWDYAKILALFYKVNIPKSTIQSSLDSYRDWLHKRSTCPRCTATGIQNNVCQYSCVACSYSWQVNQAKKCKLRRYSL